MPAHQAIFVRALWDAEARVWVATSDDVPGLVAEPETWEATRATVLVRIGDLLELNVSPSSLPEISGRFFSDNFEFCADRAHLRRSDLGFAAY